MPVPEVPEPSLKALGKRRLVDAGATVRSSSAGPATGKVDEGGKRVTRSSLGGAADQVRAAAAAASGSTALRLLPNSTPILVTLALPPNVEHHPRPDTPPPPPPPSPPTERPQFRLLGLEDSFSRSRHAGPSEARLVALSLPRPLARADADLAPLAQQLDTSDAYYLRLHRFPEVLEKRSARLERDRLIHERSKLILEIELMRGRGWVYQGLQGGKGEEIRRRKLHEGEERLKRYDALLPNQPRKSGMLNLGSHRDVSASAATGTASDSGATKSRSNSPALTPAHRPSLRHSTPLSASGDGGTTIRIKFGATAAAAAAAAATVTAGPRFSGRGPARGSSRSRAVYAEEDDDEDVDEEMFEYNGNSITGNAPMDVDPVSHGGAAPRQRKPKRDRTAERGRAAERIRLHLPPRVSLDKAALQSGSPHVTRPAAAAAAAPKKKSKRRPSNAEMDRDSDDDEPTPASPSVHSGWSDGNVASDDLLSDDEMEDYLNPIAHDLSVQALSARALAAARRLRLSDSFFRSEALRDAVAAGNRRSSGRVAYAFGTRVPDVALARPADFVPRGGGDGVPVEELIRQRSLQLGAKHPGESTTAWINGVAVPESALDVLSSGPLQYHPLLSPPVVDEALNQPVASALDPPPVLVGTPPTPPPLVPTHGHGTRHGSSGTKRTVISLSNRGKYEVKVRIDG